MVDSLGDIIDSLGDIVDSLGDIVCHILCDDVNISSTRISHTLSLLGAPEDQCYPGVAHSTALLHQSHLPHRQSAGLAVQQWLFLLVTCYGEEC